MQAQQTLLSTEVALFLNTVRPGIPTLQLLKMRPPGNSQFGYTNGKYKAGEEGRAEYADARGSVKTICEITPHGYTHRLDMTLYLKRPGDRLDFEEAVAHAGKFVSEWLKIAPDQVFVEYALDDGEFAVEGKSADSTSVCTIEVGGRR